MKEGRERVQTAENCAEMGPACMGEGDTALRISGDFNPPVL